MVNYRTRLKVPRKGVCTSYLSTLVPGMLLFTCVLQLLISSKGDTILVGISKGFITLPGDPNTPIICVGPGTGVAPMRAIIQHRLKFGAKGEIFRRTSAPFLALLKACSPERQHALFWLQIRDQRPTLRRRVGKPFQVRPSQLPTRRIS